MGILRAGLLTLAWYGTLVVAASGQGWPVAGEVNAAVSAVPHVEPLPGSGESVYRVPPATEVLSACDACETQFQLCDSGWFVGVGGSFNSVRVDSRLSGTGRTEIFDGDDLVAVGVAGGPAPPFEATGTTFAPVAQLGYYRHIRGSDWLWGGKFSYKYLGITLEQNNVDAPQLGVFTFTDDPSDVVPFTGNATVGSSQTKVNHELALLPFIGKLYSRGRVYFGGGPVVFATESRIYSLRSFADIDGEHTNIGGLPVNLASTTWMWGGAFQLGATYYLRPSCFLDFSYDFMVTGEYTKLYPTPVTSESDGLTYDTLIEYKTIDRIWAQSFNVMFNFQF